MGVFHRVTAPDRGANDSVRRDTLAGWLAGSSSSCRVTDWGLSRTADAKCNQGDSQRERETERNPNRLSVRHSASQSVSECLV